jgi:hypothetical protein
MFIIAVAIVFGLIMGTREAIAYAAAGHNVKDSRFVGLSAGVIFGAGALAILGVLWLLGSLYWALVVG